MWCSRCVRINSFGSRRWSLASERQAMLWAMSTSYRIAKQQSCPETYYMSRLIYICTVWVEILQKIDKEREKRSAKEKQTTGARPVAVLLPSSLLWGAWLMEWARLTADQAYYVLLAWGRFMLGIKAGWKVRVHTRLCCVWVRILNTAGGSVYIIHRVAFSCLCVFSEAAHADIWLTARSGCRSIDSKV